MYRRNRHAYEHSNYIRPNYVSTWTEARIQAEANGVPLSEFVSHALFCFMTGKAMPEGGRLRGRNPFHLELVPKETRHDAHSRRKTKTGSARRAVHAR